VVARSEREQHPVDQVVVGEHLALFLSNQAGRVMAANHVVAPIEKTATRMETARRRPRRLRRIRLAQGELVADTEHGDEEPRGLRTWLDLPAQILHVRVDGPRGDEPIEPVKPLEQLGAAEHAFGFGRERLQQSDSVGVRSRTVSPNVTTCLEGLKGKGVKYVELYNGPASEAVGPVFGGPQHDEQSNVLGQKYLPVCTQEVHAAQHM
jgi:hypothetical protein